MKGYGLLKQIKAAFHKFYLVHSWKLCPAFSLLETVQTDDVCEILSKIGFAYTRTSQPTYTSPGITDTQILFSQQWMTPLTMELAKSFSAGASEWGIHHPNKTISVYFKLDFVRDNLIFEKKTEAKSSPRNDVFIFEAADFRQLYLERTPLQLLSWDFVQFKKGVKISNKYLG